MFGGFQHHAIACGKGWRKLPCRHEKREVPRNDLPHHAQRFVEVIGDRIVIDFRNTAFLSADDAREIAEMINRQRQVGIGGFADRLAVVPCFGSRQCRQVFLNPVCDAIEDKRAFSHACPAP